MHHLGSRSTFPLHEVSGDRTYPASKSDISDLRSDISGHVVLTV
jgi:hypothetical protein